MGSTLRVVEEVWPMTEPQYCTFLYVSDTAIEIDKHVMMLTAWVDVAEPVAERRVQARLSMSIDAAVALAERIQTAVKRLRLSG